MNFFFLHKSELIGNNVESKMDSSNMGGKDVMKSGKSAKHDGSNIICTLALAYSQRGTGGQMPPFFFSRNFVGTFGIFVGTSGICRYMCILTNIVPTQYLMSQHTYYKNYYSSFLECENAKIAKLARSACSHSHISDVGAPPPPPPGSACF